MLLDWLGRKHQSPAALAAASSVARAVSRVMLERKTLIGDLGGTASTSEMGSAIAGALTTAG